MLYPNRLINKKTCLKKIYITLINDSFSIRSSIDFDEFRCVSRTYLSWLFARGEKFFTRSSFNWTWLCVHLLDRRLSTPQPQKLFSQNNVTCFNCCYVVISHRCERIALCDQENINYGGKKKFHVIAYVSNKLPSTDQFFSTLLYQICNWRNYSLLPIMNPLQNF